MPRYTSGRYGSGRRTNLNLRRRVVSQRLVVKTRGVSISWDKLAGQSGYWAGGDRRIGGVNLIWALVRNCGNQDSDAKGEAQVGETTRREYRRGELGRTNQYEWRRSCNGAGAKGLGQTAVFGVQLATGGGG